MDMEIETSPSKLDSEDIYFREPYRRYGKTRSPLSSSPHRDGLGSKLSGFIDEKTFYKRPNTALLLEDIKQEAHGFDFGTYEITPAKTHYSSVRKSLISTHGVPIGSHLLSSCKVEDDVLLDAGKDLFFSFASLVGSAMKGFLPFSEMILRFETLCRNQAESVRSGSIEMYKLRQKANLLLQEAASWSLVWHLYGKGSDDLPEDLLVFPTTSHLEACDFVVNDHTAQLCLRIVQWLEELASKALDSEASVRGSYVGTHIPSSGIWYHTQKVLKKGLARSNTVKCLDIDAPTREGVKIHPDDQKQDECLLEDVWTLLRAGRREEACELCRSAGQPWRAVTLLPFGKSDHFPSIETFEKNGKNTTLQAIELHNGIGHHYCLWRWACYSASEKIAEQEGGKYEIAVFAAQCSNIKQMLPVCSDWESACWAIAKSWLEVQIDMQLSELHPTRRILDQDDDTSKSTSELEKWPSHVLHQQPRNLSAMLQKLHSTDTVHKTVVRECKDRHRQIEMNLMLGDIPTLLDLIWSWISPSVDDPSAFKPHGDPQMICFGAHLVLVIRHLLADYIKDTFQEKITSVGDLILQLYAMFLFSKQHEELVGIYASQLASHRCFDLFAHMMELRLRSDVHVKYKIFLTAIEHLPFSPTDDSKGSFEEIIERVLSRSREIKYAKLQTSLDIIEQHRNWSIEKAMAVQWLCFAPPSTLDVNVKLLRKALIHGNTLLREFALMSRWRVPEMPVAAHTLLSLLAEPLKLTEESFGLYVELDLGENLREFQDWNEYFSCDAAYRNWLEFEEDDAKVSASSLSMEEKQRTVNAAKETRVCSMALLSRVSVWLVPDEANVVESAEPLFVEVHATAIPCGPSGESLIPDATLCAVLTSAFYSTIGEEVASTRQLTANVVVSPRNSCCIDVSLQCLAVEGDGIGLHEDNDGGVLAMAIAAGFKGELVHFKSGVTIEILFMDAWYFDCNACLCGEATYILRGLCRRCCLPEVMIRCMEVSVFLMKMGDVSADDNELIQLVASLEIGLVGLFSQHQLQEFLLFDREYTIWKMHTHPDISDVNEATA